MPLPNKPESIKTLILDSNYPETLPRLPDDVLKRFPSFGPFWQEEMAKWWYEFRTSLQRDLSQISDTYNQEKSSRDSQVAALTARLDDLEVRTTVLES
jgi:hypothetical protein